MLQVVDKAKRRAQGLAGKAKRTIEEELDNAIYYQMRKLEHKARFIREFWQSFEIEQRDMLLTREELLAERVALSVLKGGELRNTAAERALGGNEFSTAAATIREIE